MLAITPINTDKQSLFIKNNSPSLSNLLTFLIRIIPINCFIEEDQGG